MDLCQLDEFTCFGCCGFSFRKEEIEEAINKNSLEFKDFWYSEFEIDLEGFRDRHPKKILRKSGICYNLVWKNVDNKQVFCPLHPEALNYCGKDLREDHCTPGYLCKTAFLFRTWSVEEKKRFIEFIKSKNIDWIEYSIKIDDGSLLEEFKSNFDI